MAAEMFRANIAAFGSDAQRIQERLRDMHALVIGASPVLHDYVLMAAGIGIGKLTIFTGNHICDFDDRMFGDIQRPFTESYRTLTTYTDIALFPGAPRNGLLAGERIDAIIMDIQHRREAENITTIENTMVIETGVNQSGFTLDVYGNNRERTRTRTNNEHWLSAQEDRRLLDGSASGMCSAVCAQVLLAYATHGSKKQQEWATTSDRLHFKYTWDAKTKEKEQALQTDFSYPKLSDKRAIVVGAGGLGNWLCSYLVREGFESLLIIDDDCVEANNLNRQPYLAGGMGDLKAKTLATALSGRKSQLCYQTQRIVRPRDLLPMAKSYDVLFGCVDNPQTRRVLDEVSQRHGMLYIDGGVSASAGQVAIGIPGVQSIESQIPLDNFPEQRNACTDVNPSVVMPNAFIAGAMACEYKRICSGFSAPRTPFVYDSIPDITWYRQRDPRNTRCER